MCATRRRAGVFCLLGIPVWACLSLFFGAHVLASERLSLVSNENFVVHAPDRELAHQVLRQAEKLRDEIALQWLGEKLPPSVGPTVIQVKVSQMENKAIVCVADSPSRLSHLMWLTTRRELAAGSVLAHEMTHVVLATQYPGQIPAFANEGAASLRDGKQRREIRRRIIAWWAKTNNWPPLAKTLTARSISPNDQAGYAAAVSLTRYLLTRGDKQRFLQFALAGGRIGWDAAVSQYYGIANVTALESRWRQWITQQL